jgi:acyl-coenzyme A thioesterase PaaI-like protein
LSSARQEDILCHARILKLGRRLIYGLAECTNRDGKLLTHHTITYIRSD